MIIGTPAAYARTLRTPVRRKFAMFAGAQTLLAAAAIGTVIAAAPQMPNPVFWLAVLAVVLIGIPAAATRTRLAQLNAGIRAEDKTARYLAKSGVAAVVHGAQIPTGDVDHVALGPVALAIETKYGRGAVSVSGGKVRVGGRQLRGDPLGQARRNADIVSRQLRVQCTPVLVISEGTVRPFTADGVIVCAPESLRKIAEGAAVVVHGVEGKAVALAEGLAASR